MYVTRDGADGSITAQQAIDHIGHLADLGFDQAIMSLRNVSDPNAFDIFRDEIEPEVRKIKPAGR